MRIQIKRHKIYQDDLEWREVQDYVKQLQKLKGRAFDSKNLQMMIELSHELDDWFEWFGIRQNFYDTDWAVDPVSGSRIW